MTAGAAVMLWIALVMPLVAVVAGTQTMTISAALRWAQAAGLVTAAAWLVVALGGDVDAGPVRAHGAVGPVGVMTSLLATSLAGPLTRHAIASRQVASASVMFGLVIATGSDHRSVALWALPMAGAVLAVGRVSDSRGPGRGADPPHWYRADPGPWLGVLGAAVVTIGDSVDSLSPVQVGGVSIGGALLAVLGATLTTRSAAGVLLPAVFAVAIPASATLGDAGDLLAFLFAAGATSAAWWSSASHREGASTNVALILGFWSLATLAAGDTSGAWLLAAPAALVTLVATPATMASAAPGVLVLVTRLATGLMFDHAATRLAFGLLATLCLAGVLNGPARQFGPHGLGAWAERSGIGLAGWLIVAPATWAWVEIGATIEPAVSPLDAWAEGSGPALATGALIAAGSVVLGRTDFEGLWRLVRER